ncbi:hypothetical protein GGF46_004641 [Coemansia sp. RSA 552]|nr:hypothetical protein GGF46_004641 [Coemansia sp. RSA 552]
MSKYIDKIKEKFEQLGIDGHGQSQTGGAQSGRHPPSGYPASGYSPGGQSAPYPPSGQQQMPYPPGGQQPMPYPPGGSGNTANAGEASAARVPPGVPLPLDQDDINPCAADGARQGDKPIGQDMEFLNIEQNELVHQRFLIIYGRVGGVGQSNDDRMVIRHPYFPPLTFPAGAGYFKVLAELEEGANELRFEYMQQGTVVRHGRLTVQMRRFDDRPPLQLAVIVGADSNGQFDAPEGARGPGVNDLDACVRRLRCSAYMWQAYMAEQLWRQGFGRRTFRLDETYASDSMARDGAQRMTARVHVVRSKRTVAEIRDKERAQQWKAPPGYNRHTSESQFSLANEALDAYGALGKGQHYVVCLTADSRWDPQLGVILGHAALGGGVGARRLGVFGSHTTHAWPDNAEEIAARLLDTTKTDERILANDAKECGEYWRAANVGIGAFLHECGHLLTLSHTQSGIMSRGFNDLSRTFLVRVPGVPGAVRQRDEARSHWQRTDAVRLRHHPCMRLPTDPPLQPHETADAGFDLLPVDGGVLVRCSSGITQAEIWIGGDYRSHIEFTAENLPRRRMGAIPGPADEASTAHPLQVLLTQSRLCQIAGPIPSNRPVSLVLTARSTATHTVEDINALLRDHAPRTDCDGCAVFSAEKLGRGQMKGTVATDVRFAAKRCRCSAAPRVRAIEFRSGQHVDGLIFHLDDGSHAQIGRCKGGGSSVMEIPADDDLDHIVVNAGWWIDGLEVFTARGRRSGWKGGTGGGRHVLRPPAGYGWMGISGSGGDWLDSLTMHYAALS